MTTYISINAQTVRANAKNGTDNPPIRIATRKHDKAPRYAKEVSILGPSRLVYDPHNRILGCGARLVLVVARDKDVEVSG